MKLIFEIKIKQIGKIVINDFHLNDKRVMLSMRSFCDKFSTTTKDYFNKFKIKTEVSYEIKKDKEEKENEN